MSGAMTATGSGTDAVTQVEARLRRRVLDHLSWTVHVLSEGVERYGSAWGARTPSLPQVWTLNQLHVSDPMELDDVLSLARRHQRTMPFLHVEVEEAATARAFEAHVRADGWTVDCEVLMVLPDPPPGSVRAGSDDGSGVVDLDDTEAAAVMRRWLEEEYPALGDPVLAQLEEYTRREGALWGERVLGIRAKGGDPVAMTKLRVSGGTVWVEDVYTVPEERRRGHARRLVTAAVSLATSLLETAGGAGIGFIVADDNDWPKHLYAEVGFRPVGRVWTFHREKNAGGS
jgi:GNAT superfamily N-acetyltransferase